MMNKMKYVFLGLAFMGASMVEAASQEMGEPTRYAYITFNQVFNNATLQVVEIAGQSYSDLNRPINSERPFKIAIPNGNRTPPLTLIIRAPGSSPVTVSSFPFTDIRDGDVTYAVELAKPVELISTTHIGEDYITYTVDSSKATPTKEARIFPSFCLPEEKEMAVLIP